MKTGIIFKMESGSLWGKADFTRWNKAKWYQKLLGFFFRCYKRKFIDMMPYEVELTCSKCGGYTTITATGNVVCWKNECNK